jgi:hypothetical protein
MKSLVRCKNCSQVLSTPLTPVAEQFQPEFIDNENIIPRGYFWIAHDLATNALTGHIVINLNDQLNLTSHPDPRRNNGCCGKDGCDGPNLLCSCGVDLATERSDCWTSFYIHFEPLKVRLETT